MEFQIVLVYKHSNWILTEEKNTLNVIKSSFEEPKWLDEQQLNMNSVANGNSERSSFHRIVMALGK